MLKRNTLVFAPMEGVTDASMREWMGRRHSFDFSVAEFIRVSENVLPEKIFYREIPELTQSLKNKGTQTKSGLPVVVQLLGGDPDLLAKTAKVAVQAGATAIDLNFGCPAPTVNRHDGGATLLKYPDRLEKIVSAVRQALPKHILVTAKCRLGFDDPSVILENAKRIENGGADWITIHARTKVNGYVPPAYWEKLKPVVDSLRIPVIANGEIWKVSDFIRCKEESGASHFMLGRGALFNPYLAANIKTFLSSGLIQEHEPTIHEWILFFREFIEISKQNGVEDFGVLKRLKQWMRYITIHQNKDWFEKIKRTETIEQFFLELVSLCPLS